MFISLLFDPLSLSLNFCTYYKICLHLYPLLIALFDAKTRLSLLNSLDILVKNVTGHKIMVISLVTDT